MSSRSSLHFWAGYVAFGIFSRRHIYPKVRFLLPILLPGNAVTVVIKPLIVTRPL